MRIRIAFFVGLLSLLGAPSLRAQTGNDLFQQAIVQEQAEGNLRSAIVLYTRIVTDFLTDRPLVARALMRIGAAYDKLGDAAARTAYERIVSEFADQREALRVAQERLRVLDPDGQFAAMPPGPEPTFTLLMDPAVDIRQRHVDYSPDGTRFVTVGVLNKTSVESPGGLIISGPGGAEPRAFAQSQSDDLGDFRVPKWSPDGRHIVFTAHPAGQGAPSTGVYVVSQDGSNRKQITADASHWSRAIWTPSGNVTFTRDRELVTADLDGNTIRTVDVDALGVPEFDRIGLLAYSPDGRWLAFYPRLNGRQNEIWIMPTNGGSAHTLAMVGPYPRTDVTWSQDGRSIYFVGTMGRNIHRVGFDPRTGQALGTVAPVTSYRGVSIWAPKALANGGLAFLVVNETNLVQVGDDATRLHEARTLARGYSPQMSPDGNTVYYVGEGHGREGIFAVASDGGEPRRITSTAPAHNGALLSPDGTALAYHTHANADEASIFVLPVQGGQPRLLAQFEGENADGVTTPRWSPDASRLVYTDGGGSLIVQSAAGGEPKTIARLPQWQSATISWSPDGNSIAGFGFLEGEENNILFVVDANGGEPRRLTGSEEEGGMEGLSWHPDGERVTYMSYSFGDGDGSRMTYLDGRPPISFAAVSRTNFDYIGFWTPSGDAYVFSSSTEQGFGLFTYDEASGRTTQILPYGSEMWIEDWSGDGNSFTATKSNRTSQIWVIGDIR